MHSALAPYAAQFQATGDLQADVVALLVAHDCAHTAGHSARVAAEAVRLAERFGLDRTQAATAAWLHDISAIVPNPERIALAEALELDVLPEERRVPMIIHQKLSAAIAHELFGIDDAAVIGAIGCHTTLRVGASPLDLAVFVADKIAWDQPGDPPYHDAIVAAAAESLLAAARVYLDYLWARRATLAVIHPWLAAAHRELSGGASAEAANG